MEWSNIYNWYKSRDVDTISTPKLKNMYKIDEVFKKLLIFFETNYALKKFSILNRRRKQYYLFTLYEG